jgi:hypothetical protein
MTPRPIPAFALLLALCLALLAACDSTGGTRAKLTAMDEYAAALRWNEIERALTFVDPAVQAARPLTDLERERYKQLQVTGYEVKSRRDTPEGGVEQSVEVRVVNRNTQHERIVTVQESWRWDATAKRFWLASGLPGLEPTP